MFATYPGSMDAKSRRRKRTKRTCYTIGMIEDGLGKTGGLGGMEERNTPLFGFRWLLLNGLAYGRTQGKLQGSFVYDPSTIRTEWMRPKNDTYNVHDGLIAMVRGGKTYVAPYSEGREQAVMRAGLRKDLFPIPSLLEYEPLADAAAAQMLDFLRE